MSPPPPANTGPLRRCIRRHHPVTWTVVALHLLVALAFSLLLPMFRGPDEATHVDMVRRYRLQLGHDRPDEMVPQGADVSAAAAIVAPGDVRPRPPQLAEDATPRPDRPSFADLAAPGAPGEDMNHMTQHPPLFYAVIGSTSTFLAGLTPSGLWSWDREVYLYRVLSILLTAPLPLLVAEAALALKLSRATSAVAAAALMTVPQASSIAAGVNNDALVVLGTGAAVAASLWHLRTGSTRSALVATGAGSIAALSKATAAPLLAWVVVVVALRWWTTRRESRAGVAQMGAAGLSAVGFSWYVANLIRFKDPQPTGLRPLNRPTDFEPSRFTFLHRWLDRLSSTFWGMPARRTGVALPWFVPHALSITAFALAVVAFVDRARRRTTVLLWLLCGAQVGLLMRVNWRSHARSGALPAVQGRYLFALLVPVALLAVIGLRQIGRRLPAGWPRPSTAAVALAVTATGLTLHLLLGVSMLEGFWGAADAGLRDRLAAVRAWSPLPSAATLGMFGLTLLGSIGVLVALVRELLVARGGGASADPTGSDPTGSDPTGSDPDAAPARASGRSA